MKDLKQVACLARYVHRFMLIAAISIVATYISGLSIDAQAAQSNQESNQIIEQPDSLIGYVG